MPILFIGISTESTVAQHPKYELDLGYQSAFLSAGDYRAHSIEGSVARFLSAWNGLQVQLGIQHVPRDVDLPTAARHEPFEPGWQNLRTYVGDILLFLNMVTFSNDRVDHRFKFHLGPSLKRRRGEEAYLLLRPKFIEQYPGRVEAYIEEAGYDHLYRQSLQGSGIENGEYILFSDDVRQWAWGGTFGIGYSLAYRRFTLGCRGIARIYANEHKVYTYGLHLGYQL